MLILTQDVSFPILTNVHRITKVCLYLLHCHYCHERDWKPPFSFHPMLSLQGSYTWPWRPILKTNFLNRLTLEYTAQEVQQQHRVPCYRTQLSFLVLIPSKIMIQGAESATHPSSCTFTCYPQCSVRIHFPVQQSVATPGGVIH